MTSTLLIYACCLIFILCTPCESFSLLLIGDSFDRHFTYEWCSEKQSTHHAYSEKGQETLEYGVVWGHQNFSADPKRRPFFCRDNILNDTVATFSLFGSNLTHPYYKEHNERYHDTQFRVPLGLRDYFDMIDGLPDRIFISTTQWDASYFSSISPLVMRGDSQYRTFLHHKYETFNHLIDMVISIVNTEIERRCGLQRASRILFDGTNIVGHLHPKAAKNSSHKNKRIRNSTISVAKRQAYMLSKRSHSHLDLDSKSPARQFKTINPQCGFRVDIGLRSATRNGHTMDGIIQDLNFLMHNISIERNLLWHDFESDIWSLTDYQNDWRLFRDWLHPLKVFSTPTINKLLGRQYSPFLTHYGSIHQMTHIISSQSHFDFMVQNHIDFQLIRGTATSKQKNSQTIPVFNVTHNTLHQHIPGFGPIYYTMIVNNTRLKWFIGDVSSEFYELLRLNSQRKTTNFIDAQNTQYETHMRAVLIPLFLSTADMLLFSDDLLNSIPTQGVMPVLFNNTHPVAFTVRNISANRMDTKPMDTAPRFIPLPLVDSILKVIERTPNNVKFYNSVDPMWQSVVAQPAINEDIPLHLFNDHTLLRFFKNLSVQVVLNLTRHDFYDLKSFTKRGYSFKNVLKYNFKLKFYIDLMPLGDVLV